MRGLRPSRKITADTDDYKVNCDRCGFIVWSSQCLLEWTGLFVCEWCYEERNNQDFVRSVPEHIAVPIPRPDYGLPTLVCTTRSAIAGVAVAGCAVCGRDDLFYLGYLPSPTDEQV